MRSSPPLDRRPRRRPATPPPGAPPVAPQPRRIAVLQHEPETGAGVFADVLDRAGIAYELLETRAPGLRPPATGFDGVLALGGSLSANDRALRPARRWIADAVACDTPVLGVCLGAQLLAAALGGAVVRGPRPEVGVHDVFVTSGGRRDLLFEALPGRFPAFGWHEDTFTLPRGAVLLAGSMRYRNQAFRHGATAYGLQFHLEVEPRTVASWAAVPRYADFLARADVDVTAASAGLAAAAPTLHALARIVLDRWLLLVAGLAPVRATRLRLRSLGHEHPSVRASGSESAVHASGSRRTA